MCCLHYSIPTENAYCDWVAKSIRFHKMQVRETLFVTPEKKVEDYLTYLVVQANVAASTQNQAFNALVFLYKQVLERPLEGVEATRTHKAARIPVVLIREEVKQVLALLENTPALLKLHAKKAFIYQNKSWCMTLRLCTLHELDAK